MSKNWSITVKGPTVPTGVNQKSFVSVKLAQMGGEHKFKPGQVGKVTAGKIRLRNADQKAFTADNSEYANKDDIIDFTGEVLAVNEDKNEHAAVRVFTKT